MARAIQVATETDGCYLVAIVGTEDDQLYWPTWCVRCDSVDGPCSLGNWIRFMPSDWHPVDGPFPAHVQRVIEWAESIEDLDQVGRRDGRGWMPRFQPGQHPGLDDGDSRP